ncbi:MAG: hypothetical protein LBF78_11665 [Treponema sp.]|jgi:hypothetical protein|nr:hypothetical protein [Treponema sp.]
MGVVRFSAEDGIWIFEYRNGLNCPFSRERDIPVGTWECVNCPAFISVDRDRNRHTTVLKCGGKRLMVQQRIYVERR